MNDWLPHSYRGSVLLADIDETLRCNDCNPVQPVTGAVELLRTVRDRGFPVLYLTAAPHGRYHTLNARFLALHGFPHGPVLHRPDDNVAPNADFKTATLRTLRTAYPGVRFVCLGDNDTGDAHAYRECNGGCFIRDVRDWVVGDNCPRQGYRCVTLARGRGYDATVRAAVLQALADDA